MVKISKKISSFLVAVLILSTVLPSVAFASNSQDNIIKNKTSSNEVMTTESVESVLVFVGGIFVGFIVDGVVIYATGQSSADWVADALTYYFANPGVTSIYLGEGGGGSW